MESDIESRQIFTREEVMAAIKESNFDKGMGVDGFDGNILLKEE